MPKNVMKLSKRSVSTSLNDFDLSHRHLMGVNFGELLPVTCIETVPGDYIELSAADLIRAIPMVTSPFLRAKQHIEVWWTSYQDLWQGFESFLTKKTDPSHSVNYTDAQFCPHVNMRDLDIVTGALMTSGMTDVVGRPYADGARRLLDCLGYGRSDTSGNDGDGYSVNLFRLLQYNKIWYDEYRQKYYDKGYRILQDTDFVTGKINPAIIFSADDLPCYSEATANIGKQVANSSLNNANAVTLRCQEMCQMRYRLWKKDLFTGALPSTQFGAVSTLDIKPGDSLNISLALRLFNNSNSSLNKMAGVNGDGLLTPTDSAATFPSIENPIWQTYRTYRSGEPAIDPKGQRVVIPNVDYYSGITRDAIALGQFDVLALRKSEAIQAWRQYALTAGNRISDNMRAHYGEDAEFDDHRSTFLGSVSAPLNISDINATAQVGSGPNQGLADVAGKGLSSLDQKVFKFKAHKFGCIMVMLSILPEAEYTSCGIERNNQLLEPEDFFTKEYENLGLDPVSSTDFYIKNSGGTIIGYAPRYYGIHPK